MDAIQMLQEDRSRVRALLSELACSSRDGRARRLFANLRKEIQILIAIESEIFLPALKAAGAKAKGARRYLATLEELRAVENSVLPLLLGGDVTAPDFDRRARMLAELIEHHGREEEDRVFPLAKKLLDVPVLQDLSERMSMRKAQLGA